MGVWSSLSNGASWVKCQKCTINNSRTTPRILFAAFWMIFAFSGTIVFGVFGNIHAVVWSVLSAVLAIFILSLHIFILRDVERQKLTSWHFYVITVVGAIGFVAGLLGFIVYVILGKQHKEKGFHMHSNYVVCLWNSLTLVLGFVLFRYGKKYKNDYSKTDTETIESSATIFRNDAAETSDSL